MAKGLFVSRSVFRCFFSYVISFVMSALILSSCNSNSGFQVIQDTTAVDVPVVTQVNKESYLNGEQFCAKYVNTESPSSKEFGKWIEVPYDYSNLEKSSKKIKIYAYTRKVFDPKLPSFVMVDGGPGQNTHTFENILETDFNEIRFDQRGVGCSAPATWEEYSDPKLYSSMNTARDIDEVRKAFDLKTISIYGVSYGTVPATIYGNVFEKNLKSLVIEGVVGRVESLSRYNYDVEKFNLVIKSLNENQKKSFDDLIFGEDQIKRFVVSYFLHSAHYQDGGFRIVRDIYFKKLFPAEGGIDEKAFGRAYELIMKHENSYSSPQHPGAVDENVLVRFYCKELGGFSKDKFTLEYSKSRGFYEAVTKDKTNWADDCAKQGIGLDMENLYDERSYPTNVSVYYFQGSHDGATFADGALNHWKYVPRKDSYFLLSLKGGHNPALSKTRSNDQAIKKAHKKLFIEALSAKPINKAFVKELNVSILNSTDKEELNFKYVTWELFTDNKVSFSDIEKEFSGIRRLTTAK